MSYILSLYGEVSFNHFFISNFLTLLQINSPPRRIDIAGPLNPKTVFEMLCITQLPTEQPAKIRQVNIMKSNIWIFFSGSISNVTLYYFLMSTPRGHQTLQMSTSRVLSPRLVTRNIRNEASRASGGIFSTPDCRPLSLTAALTYTRQLSVNP